MGIDSQAFLWTGLSCALAYLLCGIPFGLVVARRHGIDVRKEGSGNIGSTNVGRILGIGPAGMTLLLDVIKGFVAEIVGVWLVAHFAAGGDMSAVRGGGSLAWAGGYIYLAAVLGHVFSIFLGFKGGKGIAVGLGAGLAYHWLMALAMLAVFIVMVIPTRLVSLGSCCAAISLPIFALLIAGVRDFWSLLPLIGVAALVLWAHRENIGRLMRREEKPFSFAKK
ncbi:MAG: glycerol-3-phosphate 1-O-acyltransferase PlsY [Atopobiaceae bacterium]|nr:glycerol-3-phosphate 1-O-acyltransferase PlsY [Atopobiaceae bacterium]